MEITGILVQTLVPVTGEGKNGTWTKQEYIIETPGQYPKKVCFSMWNDSIQEFAIGDEITAQIDIESREYNGRWYTEVKAWKVESVQMTTTPEPPAPNIDIEPESGDDVPF